MNEILYTFVATLRRNIWALMYINIHKRTYLSSQYFTISHFHFHFREFPRIVFAVGKLLVISNSSESKFWYIVLQLSHTNYDFCHWYIPYALVPHLISVNCHLTHRIPSCVFFLLAFYHSRACLTMTDNWMCRGIRRTFQVKNCPTTITGRPPRWSRRWSTRWSSWPRSSRWSTWSLWQRGFPFSFPLMCGYFGPGLFWRWSVTAPFVPALYSQNWSDCRKYSSQIVSEGYSQVMIRL